MWAMTVQCLMACLNTARYQQEVPWVCPLSAYAYNQFKSRRPQRARLGLAATNVTLQ